MPALPYILVLSTLLPYLPAGFRVEHVFLPALLLWPVLTARRVYPETPFVVGGLLLGAFAAAFASQYSWETGADADPLSQFIRLILPAVALMVLPSVLPQNENISVKVAEATAIGAALSASFAAASLISVFARDLLQFWVQSGENSVWLNSQDVGRYTGIFNQPIEAGIFYSVALIGAIHAYRYGKMSRVVLLAAMALIVFGGSASLSKNFIVLGAACTIGYAFWIKLLSRAFLIILSIPIAVLAPAGLEQLNFNYIASIRDLYLDQGLLGALSAGRFGSDTASVSLLFTSLFETGDWVRGRGLGSHLPLDSGYLEYFYQGGIFGLAGYVLALTVLSWRAWANRKHSDGRLLIVLMAYIWLSSTGGPTITASRAGIVLLIVASACVVGIRQKGETGLNGNLHRKYLNKQFAV
jgi:hypothetical protein